MAEKRKVDRAPHEERRDPAALALIDSVYLVQEETPLTPLPRLHLSLFLRRTPSVICFPTSVPPLPTMDRDSIITNFNFPHVAPSDSLPTDNLSPSVETGQPSADRSNETIATQEAEENQRKRKRPTEDDGRNDAVSSFPLQEASRLQKRMAFTADDGLDPQSRNADPVKPSKDPHSGSQGGSASIETEVQPLQLPLTVKEESPWMYYNRDYQVELGGPVSVAERKGPGFGIVVIKQLSTANSSDKISMLRLLSGGSFIRCIEIFHFENVLHVVSEYMTMTLLQIVAAPRYPRENHVAAIIGQVSSS